MTLRGRVGKLEGRRGAAVQGPSVIFLCEAETGEPRAALLLGGRHIQRDAGETAERFRARAEAGAGSAVFLPDNGRDALATGKAPAWASGALVDKALSEKHGAS